MAKKQKEETTNVNATANRDIIQRLNFLYQASIYLQSVVPSGASNSKGKERELGDKREGKTMETMEVDTGRSYESAVSAKSKKTRVHRKPCIKRTTGDLGRSYAQCMRLVGQKTTVKIDPCLKRSLCSSCNSALIPGSSASIRVKRSSAHGHILIYTCLHCRTRKRIPAPPNSLDQAPQDFLEPTRSAPTSGDISLTSAGAVIDKESLPKTQRRSRALPLFARPNAGHVVFRGNERLGLDGESGLGVLFS